MLIGVGLTDVPTPITAGGRFPPKEVRLAALDATDGTTSWSYQARFAQDSYTGYDLALTQYLTNLAPHDWDHDGVLDIVTPAQYKGAYGNNQLLLAAATQDFQVRSGADGSVLSTLNVWGSNGLAVSCGASDGNLTFITGHARRLDVTRIDADTGATLWRRPIWNDPAGSRASMSGIDMVSLTGVCRDRPTGDTLIAFDLQAFSYVRGSEFINILGVINPDDTMQWLRPTLFGDPPLGSLFDIYYKPKALPSDQERAIATYVPPVVGAGLGLLTLAPRRRHLKRTGRITPPKDYSIPLLELMVITLFLAGSLGPALDGLNTPLPPEDITPREAGLRQPPTTVAAASTPQDRADIASPFTRDDPFLHALAAVTSAQDLAFAVQDQLHRQGLKVPAAQGERMRGFEENTTLPFTYAIGDIDGDGVGDVAFDAWCADFDACRIVLNAGSAQQYLDETLSGVCGQRHALFGVSGATGDVLWNRSLNDPSLVPRFGCAVEWVVGTMPRADNGTDLLLYRYDAYKPALTTNHYIIQNTYYALEAASGNVTWTKTEYGSFTHHSNGWTSRNIALNPILHVRPSHGLPWVDASTQPGLILQGVGMEITYENTRYPVPLVMDPVWIADSYTPLEWAASIDMATGQENWRVDTFGPADDTLSVRPTTLPLNPFGGTSGSDAVYRARNAYWDYTPCCWDITGDGVPDLVYTTHEWNRLPTGKPGGPNYVSARLVVFDGATGARAYEHMLVDDRRLPLGRPYSSSAPNALGLSIQALGDVDADGAADFAVHIEFFDHQYHHIVSVRSGKQGNELWRRDSPRDLLLTVLGDVDRDGGNDLLLLDWHMWEFPTRTYWGRVNVTATPLRALSGLDGRILWNATTYAPPTELALALALGRDNGLPDLDGDGVADVLIDDPIYLRDLTIVHRQTYLSGRDASPLFSFTSVGAFAYPVRTPDVTGDGIDDVQVLSGDLSDLWVTQYASNGTALWSRRVLALPASSYAWSFPNIRVLDLGTNASAQPLLFVQLQLNTYTISGTYRTIRVTTNEGVTETSGLRRTYAMVPQIVLFGGRDGALPWTYPLQNPAQASDAIEGPTPATTLFNEVFLAQATTADVVSERTAFYGPGIAGFALSYLGVLLVGTLIGRWRRRE
jgi:hypothetical protein